MKKRFIIEVTVEAQEETADETLTRIAAALIRARFPKLTVDLYRPNEDFRPISFDDGTGWASVPNLVLR